MLWWVYNALFLVGFLLLLPRFLWRMQRRGGYRRNFMQRLGRYKPDIEARLAEGGWVWIHAVSVGEMMVALKLLETLRTRQPEAKYLVSTTTSTAHAIGAERLDPADALIYFPLDLPWIVHRVLNIVRPRAILLIEAEFWPNLLREAARRGIPKILVNGRISEKSQRGYRKLRIFTREIFPLFEALCVQSEADRDRLLELGALPQTLHVMHSAKYETAERNPAAEAQARVLLDQAGFGADRPLLLGGSTWAGEEEALLAAYRALRKEFPELRLVLAPRHVERTLAVLDEIHAAGLSFVRRSQLAPPLQAAPDVFVLDTTGELTSFYPHATVIFVGKSLCSHGGQNIIEPAVCGKPVVVGPHMENFPVVMQDFLAAEAVRQIESPDALIETVRDLLAHPETCATIGERAARLVSERSGAIRATVDLLEQWLHGEPEA